MFRNSGGNRGKKEIARRWYELKKTYSECDWLECLKTRLDQCIKVRARVSS